MAEPVLIVQHVAAEPPGRIADALAEQGVPYRTIRVFENESVPESIGRAAGLVVMGGPMGVGDRSTRDHLRTEQTLIESALHRDRPVRTVCLGSQLLAHVFGARVRPGPQTDIGWETVTLTDAAADDRLWHGIDRSFPAFHWHGDVFDLPDGAVRLARSAQTPCQAFRYGETVYGVFFHLEMPADVIAAMTDVFDEELREEGLNASVIREGNRPAFRLARPHRRDGPGAVGRPNRDIDRVTGAPGPTVTVGRRRAALRAAAESGWWQGGGRCGRDRASCGHRPSIVGIPGPTLPAPASDGRTPCR